MVKQRSGEEAGCFFLVLGSGARAGLGLKALATSAFGLKKPGEKEHLVSQLRVGWPWFK